MSTVDIFWSSLQVTDSLKSWCFLYVTFFYVVCGVLTESGIRSSYSVHLYFTDLALSQKWTFYVLFLNLFGYLR